MRTGRSDSAQPPRALAAAPPSSTRAMLWLRLTAPDSAEHGRRDDDANAKDNRTADNRGRYVPLFDNFLVKLTWREAVESFVAENREGDANNSEHHHVSDG